MIATKHLFAILDNKLIELLRSLTPDEWHKPTLAKKWDVKDIAAHLLDTNVRSLAARDNHFLKAPVNVSSYADLVNYLNQLNAEWVIAARRISPQVLTDFLEDTGKQYSSYINTLGDNVDAPYSVAWAGEEKSAMWFHIARDYTEKWHHQQQIRHATGKEGIMTRELFYPCIDTFLQGLPHTYRNITATENTVIKITIDTSIGGDWYMIYNGKNWQLTKNKHIDPSAVITLSPDAAWKLFTKGISAQDAKQQVTFMGDEDLADVVLDLVAVMA